MGTSHILLSCYVLKLTCCCVGELEFPAASQVRKLMERSVGVMLGHVELDFPTLEKVD
jgi:hypothetical protein